MTLTAFYYNVPLFNNEDGKSNHLDVVRQTVQFPHLKLMKLNLNFVDANFHLTRNINILACEEPKSNIETITDSSEKQKLEMRGPRKLSLVLAALWFDYTLKIEINCLHNKGLIPISELYNKELGSSEYYIEQHKLI
ncbi:22949_t:CDS:2 [Cetraspora pellucida]|uniref:22949_t:CDS:1 n=1 Tax=Cetraspora pellucida TaxID=1433469 RepID=A0A9N9HY72_9GLOM|nr:22949_t:CDS:2 [Cetraspora pellucida]